MAKNKYTQVGKITKNKTEDGKEYYKMILDGKFYEDPKGYSEKAYPLKDGGRSFYMFKPTNENAPEWILFDICVKEGE